MSRSGDINTPVALLALAFVVIAFTVMAYRAGGGSRRRRKRDR
ncbi:hypothetical protein SAMN05216298_0304 [Glycomyces sambucus]|uniref:Uncharacterized protein n=1 Tax=Glycomyces sambucus TaxID=380244 RepID=A0A1G9CFF3_9ACTN|nr:hypothetical protein [Glycomyces sambucus]SDK50316.1 hypothetical protein SAMN05216298_0304 [Glycomyces sambucus]